MEKLFQDDAPLWSIGALETSGPWGSAIVALGKVGDVFLHLCILFLGWYIIAANRKRFSSVHVVLNLLGARREEQLRAHGVSSGGSHVARAAGGGLCCIFDTFFQAIVVLVIFSS